MRNEDMTPDSHLKIEILSSAEDAKHRITAPKEIEFLLRNIAAKHARVALYYAEASCFYLTVLLGVSERGLWVEQSPKSAVNEAILNDSKLTFVSSHMRVKVQFEAQHPLAEQYDGKAAFLLPLPLNLLRLQRREYFRLPTPNINPLKCIIPISGHPHPKLNEVTIMDISVGGAALTCAEDDTELIPGETYSDCRIDLPEFGTISGTLVVRNWAILTAVNGQNYKRAGCELQDMDNPSIALLNRYIIHMQRVH
jgi:c-di-GMP-binding flagellar brake protein YcgR